MSDWREKAACKGKPTGFFPDESHLREVSAARKMCVSCPVQMECLEAATEDDKWSIRGGLDHGQRQRLRVRVA